MLVLPILSLWESGCLHISYDVYLSVTAFSHYVEYVSQFLGFLKAEWCSLVGTHHAVYPSTHRRQRGCCEYRCPKVRPALGPLGWTRKQCCGIVHIHSHCKCTLCCLLPAGSCPAGWKSVDRGAIVDFSLSLSLLIFLSRQVCLSNYSLILPSGYFEIILDVSWDLLCVQVDHRS